MHVDVTTLSSYQKQFDVLVPAAKVKAEIDAAFKAMSGKARLPGFRPGHAPRAVLEARYMPQVCADVANNLMNSAWRKALEDHKLVPITEPKVEAPAALRPQDDFRFTIRFEVRPEFSLTKYTGLEVAWPSADTDEAEVDRAVQNRVAQSARLVEVTGRAATAADLAMVEFVGRVDGDEVCREVGTLVKLDGDPWYTGIEPALIGLSVGDAFDQSVAFSNDARTEPVAGRTVRVEGKLLSLQATEVPPLSDALAAELGYEGGVDGMRAALRARLTAGREETARNQARANLLERLIEANPFDVPVSMSNMALKMLVEELRHQQAARTGQNPKTIGFSAATMEDLARRSVFAAKAELLVERIATVEQIAPNEDNVEARIRQMAEERDQAVEAVRGWYARDRAREELLQRLKEEMTLDWLLERSVIVAPAPAAAPAAVAPAADAPAAEAAPASPEPEAATEPEAAAPAKRPRKKKE
jgi:trigger factor